MGDNKARGANRRSAPEDNKAREQDRRPALGAPLPKGGPKSRRKV